MVSKTDRDGGIRTRQIPVTRNTGYLCMLDDLGSARPRASIEPQKGRGSTKHVLPTPSTAAHRHGYFLIYFFCIELNCNRFFCAFALPTRVAFGTHGFVNQIVHTYIYTNSRLAPKRIPLLYRRVAKESPMESVYRWLCAKPINTCSRTKTRLRYDPFHHPDIICQINPPFSTYQKIPKTVVIIPLVFDAQSITLDRPLIRKKKSR